MYSFGTGPQAPHEPYGEAFAGRSFGAREGGGEFRAAGPVMRGPLDGINLGGPQPSVYGTGPASSPMDGLLQVFGDFLRSAFGQLSQMLTGLLGGGAAG